MNELYNKYKNTKNTKIYEIVLQYYLIQSKYRKIAYISGYLLTKSKLNILIKFMNKNNISYKLIDKNYNFIIYDPNKINIDNINKMNSKEIGKLLGDFYICASNNYGGNNEHRIVINFNNVEIYAQMCKKTKIIENLDKIYIIYLDIYKLFNKLDKNIFGKVEIYKPYMSS